MPHMSTKTKTIVANISFRVVWAILLSVLASLTLIFITRFGGFTQQSLEYILYRNFISLFFIFFVIFSFILLGLLFLSLASSLSDPKIFQRIAKKLRSVSVENRRLIAEFCRWTSICLLLIVLVLASLITHEASTDSAPSYLSIWLLITYFLPVFLISIARFSMNSVDRAIYHLQRFRKTKASEDLEKALKDYNRILGSSLSLKKLLTISQCVTEAFKILTHKKSQQFDTQIQDIIGNLKAENISEANAGLIALSNSVMEQIEDHIQTLGFEVKYPRRLRFSEATKAILNKVFPQFMVFMIWIGLVILLGSLWYNSHTISTLITASLLF